RPGAIAGLDGDTEGGRFPERDDPEAVAFLDGDLAPAKAEPVDAHLGVVQPTPRAGPQHVRIAAGGIFHHPGRLPHPFEVAVPEIDEALGIRAGRVVAE